LAAFKLVSSCIRDGRSVADEHRSRPPPVCGSLHPGGRLRGWREVDEPVAVESGWLGRLMASVGAAGRAAANRFQPFTLPEGSPSTNGPGQGRASGAASLDHLVRAHQQRLRGRTTDGLRSLQVDHEFEVRGLLDRKVGGLRPVEHLDDIAGRLNFASCNRKRP